MIWEIFNLCNKPSPACDHMKEQVLTPVFQDEIDLGNKFIEIDTEDEQYADLFTTNRWTLRFYPQDIVENFFIRYELLELADRAKERSANTHSIYSLADEYFKQYSEQLEYATKYGYDGLPCYMVVYNFTRSIYPTDVFTVKPCVILDFLKSKKITAV
jgi:hypothetical protein